MRLHATVHYGESYCNAFWNGKMLIFGDGDGEIFNRFTAARDIIAYELARAIVETEAGLEFWGESGALVTSMSDVFSALTKQFLLDQTAEQADWLVAERLFRPGVNARGLRSLKEPGTAFDDPRLGKDSQPAHMRDFVRTNDDAGGVHINSGIPNKAFYLIATAIGGRTWERAGRIWYQALCSILKPTTGIREFARLTLLSAQRLYGRRSPDARAVKAGWQKVGIRARTA
jgi:Zn-dependent metalloprotease